MEYALKSGDPVRQRTSCLVVGVLEPRRMTEAARRVNEASGGLIERILRRGDFRAEAGETLLLPEVGGVRAERVLLVGCGRPGALDERAYRKAATGATKALRGIGCPDAVSYLCEAPVRGRERPWRVGALVEATEHALYRFETFRSDAGHAPTRLQRVTVGVPHRRDLRRCQPELDLGAAIGAGTALARDLGNTPANVCTPRHLEEQARILAEQHDSIQARALDWDAMEELGMHCLLSVAQGSAEPPRLLVMEHDGRGAGAPADAPPVVLVGKGITFDSGGISIKGSAQLDEMKYDMAGAAAVFGTLRACAEASIPLRVVGLIPAVENMPDGAATRPGDIVTTLAGKTVEVLNTDAEGRMVLADAITYARRFEPAAVVDIATLTGACVMALGHHRHGVMGNARGLVRELLQAGSTAHDRAWELPLDDEYDEQLQSPFADIANIGGRPAGAITAGCFLGRFATELRWAHLDIAGTAWQSGEAKGATGRPVPLLTRFLSARAGAPQ